MMKSTDAAMKSVESECGVLLRERQGRHRVMGVLRRSTATPGRETLEIRTAGVAMQEMSPRRSMTGHEAVLLTATWARPMKALSHAG